MTMPPMQAAPPQNVPFRQLKTDRNLWVWLGLSIITFGIYSIIVWYTMAEDINMTAQRDGKKTMNYLLVILLSMVTFGIFMIVWMHMFSDRVGNEARRRNLGELVSAKDFWLWYVLGSLIIIGPFVYMYKVFNAMNHINGSYNQYGA
ncbi:MAG: DUF4234 domain-containing protein [Promicromonosporaceae bacterium]|nr:DUF4234 domain-containing protein [Promicromonosporaceae bacterium]